MRVIFTMTGNPPLGYDYTMQFISCDSIQTCSFVSGRIQSHTMIYREFKRIGHTPSKTSPTQLRPESFFNASATSTAAASFGQSHDKISF